MREPSRGKKNKIVREGLKRAMNLHMRRVCFLSSSKFVWGAQAGPIKFNGSRQKCIVFGGQVSAFALVQNKKHTPRFHAHNAHAFKHTLSCTVGELVVLGKGERILKRIPIVGKKSPARLPRPFRHAALGQVQNTAPIQGSAKH